MSFLSLSLSISRASLYLSFPGLDTHLAVLSFRSSPIRELTDLRRVLLFSSSSSQAAGFLEDPSHHPDTSSHPHELEEQAPTHSMASLANVFGQALRAKVGSAEEGGGEEVGREP